MQAQSSVGGANDQVSLPLSVIFNKEFWRGVFNPQSPVKNDAITVTLQAVLANQIPDVSPIKVVDAFQGLTAATAGLAVQILWNNLPLWMKIVLAIVFVGFSIWICSWVLYLLLIVLRCVYRGSRTLVSFVFRYSCCFGSLMNVRVRRVRNRVSNAIKMHNLKKLKLRKRIDEESLLAADIYHPVDVKNKRGKEAAMPGSRVYEADEYPGFQGEFVAGGEIMGYFSRIHYEGKDCLLTAAHVLESNKLTDLAIAKGPVMFSLSDIRPVRIILYSPSDELDYLIMEMPTSVFSKLGLKVGKMSGKIRNTMPVSIYRRVGDKVGVASGTLVRDRRTPWTFKHGCSTSPGISGAPVVAHGMKIVGIHLQYDRDLRVNIGMVPSHLYSKLTKESVTNEDAYADEDLPVTEKKLDSHAEEYNQKLQRENEADYNATQAAYYEMVNNDHEPLMATEKPQNWAEAMDSLDEYREKKKNPRQAKQNDTDTGKYDTNYYMGYGTKDGQVIQRDYDPRRRNSESRSRRRPETKWFCPSCLNLVCETDDKTKPLKDIRFFKDCINWLCTSCTRYYTIGNLRLDDPQDDRATLNVRETENLKKICDSQNTPLGTYDQHEHDLAQRAMLNERVQTLSSPPAEDDLLEQRLASLAVPVAAPSKTSMLRESRSFPSGKYEDRLAPITMYRTGNYPPMNIIKETFLKPTVPLNDSVSNLATWLHLRPDPPENPLGVARQQDAVFAEVNRRLNEIEQQMPLHMAPTRRAATRTSSQSSSDSVVEPTPDTRAVEAQMAELRQSATAARAAANTAAQRLARATRNVRESGRFPDAWPKDTSPALPRKRTRKAKVIKEQVFQTAPKQPGALTGVATTTGQNQNHGPTTSKRAGTQSSGLTLQPQEKRVLFGQPIKSNSAPSMVGQIDQQKQRRNPSNSKLTPGSQGLPQQQRRESQ